MVVAAQDTDGSHHTEQSRELAVKPDDNAIDGNEMAPDEAEELEGLPPTPPTREQLRLQR